MPTYRSRLRRATQQCLHADPLLPHSPAEATATSGACRRTVPQFIDLYDAELTRVRINVPTSALLHLPTLPPAKKGSMCPRYRLCSEYLARGCCDAGELCGYVHQSPQDPLPSQPVHVNSEWGDGVPVENRAPPYPTHAPGSTFRVYQPNGRMPYIEVDSGQVYVTQGSSERESCSSSRPMSHCAHFYFNRICNRGDRCLFVHVALVACPEGSAEDPVGGPRRRLAANDHLPILCEQHHHHGSRSGDEAALVAIEVPTIEISRASPAHSDSRSSTPPAAVAIPLLPSEFAGPSSDAYLTPVSMDASLSGSFDRPILPPSNESSLLSPRSGASTPLSRRGSDVQRGELKSPTLRSVSVGVRTLLIPADRIPSSDSTEELSDSAVSYRNNPYGSVSRPRSGSNAEPAPV